MDFELHSEYSPTGDQPEAIGKLTEGVLRGDKAQTLLGVTGSGKTFTMANVIKNVGRPALVLAHNKTLAAQLCAEFREYFPNNCVEYFVSYYDYYQPEAYIAASDTYIEKDAMINDEIDRLRHSATAALLERRDVIIVASVSCIYGLGDPEDYTDLMISLRPGMSFERDELIRRFIELRYERNEMDLHRNCFRVKGDTIDIVPSDMSNHFVRIEFWGDEIDKLSEIDLITGEIIGGRNHVAIFPASHYATKPEKLIRATDEILLDMEKQADYFSSIGKELESHRIEQRTRYDVEMMRETGFCQGIENYSRYISGRKPGVPPYTLIDYFPKDFLLFIDEAHVTIPQVRAMYNGDHARKTSLIDYGFRLPSAYDNRPLNFDEFNSKINQVIYVSATPSAYEKGKSTQIVEQLIRPTGLLDPEIIVRPVENQVDDLLDEIKQAVSKNSRVLVTTLTKRMAESLTDYLSKAGVKVRYLHSDIHTIERMEIVRDLRMGEFDVLVGINLLREGLDIPEVSLVAILDADKEGFLRSETSLVQTIGRAARNAEGKVIMYADTMTESLTNAINETNRRREIQKKYNDEHGITPKTIKKNIQKIIESVEAEDKNITKKQAKSKRSDAKLSLNDIYKNAQRLSDIIHDGMSPEVLSSILNDLMIDFAENMEFEKAAKARDLIKALKELI